MNTLRAFDEFWDAYPRKVSKPHAAKAWRTNGCERIADAVVAGLKRWIASDDWTARPVDKLPYPATWLNGQRWNDEPAKVEAPRRLGELVIREVSPDEAARLKQEAAERAQVLARLRAA